MKNKKEILISIISLITIVIIVAGVSLAFFNYTQTGTTDNTLETGNITFLYTETSEVGRGISITDALPMTDEEGKLLTGEGNVFDFNIAATTASNINIPYEITLEKLDESGIEGNCIRVYLTKVNGLTEEELVLDTFTNLEQTTRTNDKVEKVLYKDAIDVNKNYNQDYRLRMWVTNNYGDNDIGKSFMIKVNVYADGNVGSLCEYEPGQTWDFSYTGNVQEWTVPTGCSGTYKLEVWGAQNGLAPYQSESKRAYGGYSYGSKSLLSQQNLYVCVGGKGEEFSGSSYPKTLAGGYNGGGNGIWSEERVGGGAGGGATHIAFVSGTLAEIGYESFVTQGNGLIVAGGAGGGYTYWGDNMKGGAGGGLTGGNPETVSSGYNNKCHGGGQSLDSVAGNFGAGKAQGGGGGFYGGGAMWAQVIASGGGSSWIAGVDDGATTAGVNSGNGKAKITLVSLD